MSKPEVEIERGERHGAGYQEQQNARRYPRSEHDLVTDLPEPEPVGAQSNECRERQYQRKPSQNHEQKQPARNSHGARGECRARQSRRGAARKGVNP